MDPVTLARGLGIARAALGAALVVAPAPLARLWVGRDAHRAAGRLPTVALGAREIAIGLGVVQALAGGADARPWLRAGALGDAVDAVSTLRAREEIPALGVALVTAMATGGAALGAWLSTAVEPTSP